MIHSIALHAEVLSQASRAKSIGQKYAQEASVGTSLGCQEIELQDTDTFCHQLVIVHHRRQADPITTAIELVFDCQEPSREQANCTPKNESTPASCQIIRTRAQARPSPWRGTVGVRDFLRMCKRRIVNFRQQRRLRKIVIHCFDPEKGVSGNTKMYAIELRDSLMRPCREA